MCASPPFASRTMAGSESMNAQRRKYNTSPKRPESGRMDSNRMANPEHKKIPGSASQQYVVRNTSGSNGASPRMRNITIELPMQAKRTVVRYATAPKNFPATYSMFETGVAAMMYPV